MRDFLTNQTQTVTLISWASQSLQTSLGLQTLQLSSRITQQCLHCFKCLGITVAGFRWPSLRGKKCTEDHGMPEGSWGSHEPHKDTVLLGSGIYRTLYTTLYTLHCTVHYLYTMSPCVLSIGFVLLECCFLCKYCNCLGFFCTFRRVSHNFLLPVAFSLPWQFILFYIILNRGRLWAEAK